jgi:hypothetical protein
VGYITKCFIKRAPNPIRPFSTVTSCCRRYIAFTVPCPEGTIVAIWYVFGNPTWSTLPYFTLPKITLSLTNVYLSNASVAIGSFPSQSAFVTMGMEQTLTLSAILTITSFLVPSVISLLQKHARLRSLAHRLGHSGTFTILLTFGEALI